MKLVIFGAGKIVNDFASIVDDLPDLSSTYFWSRKRCACHAKLQNSSY